MRRLELIDYVEHRVIAEDYKGARCAYCDAPIMVNTALQITPREHSPILVHDVTPDGKRPRHDIEALAQGGSGNTCAELWLSQQLQNPLPSYILRGVVLRDETIGYLLTSEKFKKPRGCSPDNDIEILHYASSPKILKSLGFTAGIDASVFVVCSEGALIVINGIEDSFGTIDGWTDQTSTYTTNIVDTAKAKGFIEYMLITWAPYKTGSPRAIVHNTHEEEFKVAMEAVGIKALRLQGKQQQKH